ncbi:MAG: hypothetical protein ACI9JP_003868, partial [Granulosicoccus sp.]
AVNIHRSLITVAAQKNRSSNGNVLAETIAAIGGQAPTQHRLHAISETECMTQYQSHLSRILDLTLFQTPAKHPRLQSSTENTSEKEQQSSIGLDG